MKVALVYDRINKWGGAERVLLALHELFPDAPLFTSVYNKEKAPWAKVFDIHTSFLQNFPNASSSHELYASLMPLAFESFSFDEFDVVISVTSEAAKGIITKPHTLHICYCLTPTRYLWVKHDEYFSNKFFKFISFPAVSYLRNWDKIASQRPDMYIAISKEVQNRIKKYYGRKSEVIYPPLTLASGELASSVSRRLPYFLLVSRLVHYKRIDLAIEAFNKLELPLKIIGVGSDEKKLRSLANSNVEFLNNLTDEDLVGYYEDCKALIFTGEEDFGLVMVEAQSFGKPVIAYQGGGALEIIEDGKTGLFFYPQTSKALIGALKKFQNAQFDLKNCIKRAELFQEKQFKKLFLETIEKNLKNIQENYENCDFCRGSRDKTMAIVKKKYA